MKKVAFYIFAIVALLASGIANTLLVLFVGNFYLSRGVDSDTALVDPLIAVIINLGLLLLFGIQHSWMARESFKSTLTRYIPAGLERLHYVLITSLILIFIVRTWQPIPYVVWHTDIEWIRIILFALFFLGVFLTLTCQFQFDVNELSGIKQMRKALGEGVFEDDSFRIPILYRSVRHPLYLGLIIAFWASPTMTLSHLMFSIGMTIYILIGISFEEKDLIKKFGESYERYKANTPMLFPKLRIKL